MSIKDAVLEAVRQLPDDVGFKDALKQLETLAVSDGSEKDAPTRRLVSHDEAKRRIASWLARESGRKAP